MSENERAAASREVRFTEAFGTCYDPVLAYARRRVGADLAQDVVAEAFLAAWRNFEELPPEPLPWLYRSSADVFAPGEVLHCSGLLSAPATAALQVLRKLGLHATWWALRWPNWPLTSSNTAGSLHHERPAGYIVEGDPASAHYVNLGTVPVLPHNRQFRDLVAKWNRGCP